MRSVLFVLSASGAVSHASTTCTSSTCASTDKEEADANSLLQAQSLVRKQRAKMTDANELLESMQGVANSFTKGAVDTMTPDQVNDAIGTANAALQSMLPLLEQQHNLAEQEIQHALGAVQACHSEHGGEVRARMEQAVARELEAKEQCDEALLSAIDAEKDACEGQGADPNCLCNEARTAITDQTVLCAAVTETYEAVYCEHHAACTMLHECHTQESEGFGSIAG